ncbi:hypothetical protein [Phocoenobacter skyensis]|uniref:Uncharacterized protein n=1 Tax=Phocoenobacter skyensis TaxID=97481 RepID=A0A1H8A4D8_9PAST|nr:hypothetical protein [Pasteurella skyensis]QLB23325.1 hypothetical protein A6B44_08945 [Pasteurella skyensis]SEM65451.1 hypothetical protein SAMN05444853_1374 [Pasteurella skyensis]
MDNLSLIELLDLLCPAVSSVETDKKEQALTFAVKKVKVNLSEDEKREAQVYYAGYLLTNQKRTQSIDSIPIGVTREEEGDLSRSYGDNGVGIDLYGYLAAYQNIIDSAKQTITMVPMSRS